MSVYLNRLRVIHDLSELDMLEVFNAVGATAFREMLEDKAVAVVRPAQTVSVKNDDTIVMTRQEIHKAVADETWDRLLGTDK